MNTKHLVFLGIILLIQHTSYSIPLTARDVQGFNRISSPVVSPGKDFVVYEIKYWDESIDKSTTHLECIHLPTKNTYILTSPEVGKRDYNVVFSSQFPNYMAFLSNRSGSIQIWAINFISTDILLGKKIIPQQLSNYEIPIANLKWKLNFFAFSAEVYTSCNDDFNCTQTKDAEIQKRGKNTYAVYDSLFMRHWDTWLTEKVSHIFTQEVGQNLTLKGKVQDRLHGMKTNSPVPPMGGLEEFDIYNTSVVLTGQDRTRDESWRTDWKIYLSSSSSTPEHLTPQIIARTQNPKFSPNGQRIAFLSMSRPNKESDKLHLEVYENGVTIDITSDFDRSIIDYIWIDNNLIMFTATDNGVDGIYVVETAVKGKVFKLTNDLFNNDLPIKINDSTFVVKRTSISQPADLFSFEFNKKYKAMGKMTRLTYVNSDKLSQFTLGEFESFNFIGGYNDTIQGFLVKPPNFDSTKKYPLAFLIHGGPEGAWKSSFGYGWNSQMWTNRGYVVVMINPHGSVGMGQNFTDDVLNNWGGTPYKDLMTGFDYVIKTYPFIDGSRACAAGASYGGYMVNWIQGQTDRFKCLVTHDGVFNTLAALYSTEELWFPLSEYCPVNQYGCKPWDPLMREGYLKYSPEAYVKNWRTPHLIIHGTNDFRLSITEGLSAFSALQVRNVPSRFLHFPEENHWTLREENVIKWYEEILGWFDKWTNN